MEVIIEVLGTTNNVLARERFAQDRVRLGRGFGNDLIIDDVHVDLEHAEIGEVLGASEPTVRRHWAFARSWLYAELKKSAQG